MSKVHARNIAVGGMFTALKCKKKGTHVSAVLAAALHTDRYMYMLWRL